MANPCPLLLLLLSTCAVVSLAQRPLPTTTYVDPYAATGNRIYAPVRPPSFGEGLLGFVEETWSKVTSFNPKKMTTGMWVLAGMLIALGVVSFINTLLSLVALAGNFLTGGGKSLFQALFKLLGPLVGRGADVADAMETEAEIMDSLQSLGRAIRTGRKLYAQWNEFPGSSIE
ncbi:unnamed protein product [Cyprideis torosa]|uniref:Uncharacterized protein n=1 Tax=Cyprideis torosa TaxID=163714 RepID=A0A7R8ZJG6_9CRUS|nr:unnamed protein product [Cyprideis torosa]CAG0882222.1 unnamed protein product [Cyprideis torosa]